MTYETILLDRKDHVTTVTLNRPDKLNALDGPRPGGQHLRRPRYREAADRLDQWRRGRRRLHDDPVV